MPPSRSACESARARGAAAAIDLPWRRRRVMQHTPKNSILTHLTVPVIYLTVQRHTGYRNFETRLKSCKRRQKHSKERSGKSTKSKFDRRTPSAERARFGTNSFFLLLTQNKLFKFFECFLRVHLANQKTCFLFRLHHRICTVFAVRLYRIEALRDEFKIKCLHACTFIFY